MTDLLWLSGTQLKHVQPYSPRRTAFLKSIPPRNKRDRIRHQEWLCWRDAPRKYSPLGSCITVSSLEQHGHILPRKSAMTVMPTRSSQASASPAASYLI